MLNDAQIKKIFLENKILDEKQIKEAEKTSSKEKVLLGTYILDKNLVKESLFFETIANYFKIPFVDLKNIIIRKDILYSIPEPIAKAHEIIAFDQNDEFLFIATLDPLDLQTLEFIKKKINKKIKIHLTDPKSIQEALRQYHKSLEAEFKDLTQPEKNQTDKDLKELAEDLPVIRIVDTLLEYAIFEGASDIHIEPAEKNVIVRYRIDGILRDVMTLPKTVQAGVAARIKVIANLKIDEHRLPQDGRFKIETDQYKVAFRVSIIPVFDGEKIVLRLLDESSKVMSLEQLGFAGKSLDIIKRNIQKPHGMMLVTGPTGSGKTTTLYTIMNLLNTPKVNISTVEDPIEYRMPRINQSQVNPKIEFTFARGLRSLLRQDPDIIMVGEIRDKETAEIAINAAMTGHLVLSTLHTNDVASTPQRLINMGISSFLISSTTNVIIAQRLARKICQNCLVSYNLDKKLVETINKNFNVDKILKIMAREGVITNDLKDLESLLFYQGKGCKQCNNQGYKGRVGLYEVLEITPKIANLITNRAPANEIQKAALEENMLTMLQDGFIKAKKAITTLEEVLRVTQE